MYAHRSHLIARLLMLGAALLLIAAAGALYWHFHRDSKDAHLEAITDMLAAREVGEMVYLVSRKDCAQYPGACEHFDKLGPFSRRDDLKRVFAPLYAPHISAASARRVAAAFAGTVGQQANRAQREKVLKKSDFWNGLAPGERKAIDALLASPEGVAYKEARRLVGDQLIDSYIDLMIAQQTQMMSVAYAAIAAYTKEHRTLAGATPPSPLVLAAIDNRYYDGRARIMARSASQLALAFWTFRRSGGALLGQARDEVVLADAGNTARAVAALQQLKPHFERYLNQREGIYQERFLALTKLERQSTGGGAAPDLAPIDDMLGSDLAGLEADRTWWRLAGRVYLAARDHPYLVNRGTPPARRDSAFEQRFASDLAELERINSESKAGLAQRDMLRETLIAGKLGDLLDKEDPPAPSK